MKLGLTLSFASRSFRNPKGAAGRAIECVLALSLLVPAATQAQQERFNRPNWHMVQRGMQAMLQCNGLFTSDRTLEQVLNQELGSYVLLIGPASDDYEVDWERKAVAVGAPGEIPTMRAAFREGLGCVVMAPEQSLDDIDELPILQMPRLAGDASSLDWPDGDVLEEKPLPPYIDAKALQAASDWAFDHESTEVSTISLILVHQGDIIHERYAPGFDKYTKTRTWSTAKSIAATLVGILVDEGRLLLDGPLPFEWPPERPAPEMDPRNGITLRHVLNMSSGLTQFHMGHWYIYWGGGSLNRYARRRALVREPGTSFNYSTYDTHLSVLAMKEALGDEQTYLEFPRKALLDRIGMRNTLVGTDRFGDFVLSSQVYTTARDLARFGLLYEQEGIWNGERILSREWIDFVTTPAPTTAEIGNFYGAQWWLVPDDRADIPGDAYATNGHRGQYAIVVPSHDLVIIRRGLDNQARFDRWDLVREVLKAFELGAAG